MTLQACEACSVTYEAKRPSSKFCSPRCRQRYARHRATGAPLPQVKALPVARSETTSGLVDSVTAQLEGAGRLDGYLGQQALALASKIDVCDSGSALAALSKELRAVMAEALQNVTAAADPLDELKNRRDRKRRSG